MSKKSKKKLNYFAGRIGFKGANTAAVATYKSKDEVIALYPNWHWSTSDEAFFNSITDKITIDNG